MNKQKLLPPAGPALSAPRVVAAFVLTVARPARGSQISVSQREKLRHRGWNLSGFLQSRGRRQTARAQLPQGGLVSPPHPPALHTASELQHDGVRQPLPGWGQRCVLRASEGVTPASFPECGPFHWPFQGQPAEPKWTQC